ncbi:MAG: (d)CMP kinase [Holosporaceae bacterium]|jgi:cytidylate kinase|nr:(d)CMP kinase [Holosporaceae bacterium]
MKPVIAIDGPSGSGKGTIAQRLADYWEFAYLDTGLLYRLVAYKNIESLRGTAINDLLKLTKETPEKLLRSTEIGIRASEVAKSPEVRTILTEMQRAFMANPGAEYKGAVLDGRDIGTVVAPDADCKIFITADLGERAKRRFESLKQFNPNITFKEIYESLKTRDENDRSRENAPLICTEDYIILDTTTDSPEESFEKALIASKKLSNLLGQ